MGKRTYGRPSRSASVTGTGGPLERERGEVAKDLGRRVVEVRSSGHFRSQSSEEGLVSLRERAREYSENIRRKRQQEAKKRESRP